MRHFLRSFAAATLSAVSVIVVWASVPMSAMSIDFTLYYAAGRQLLNGLSPYALYGPYSLPFQYPPWCAWPFALIALLPPMTAQHVHSSLILCVTLGAILLLLSALRWKPRPASVFVLVALSFVAARFVLTQGQVCHVQLLGVTLSIWALTNNLPVLAGLTAPILLIKPHLIAIYLPALLWRAGRRAQASAAISVGLLTAIAFLLEPRWPLNLWESAAAAWLRPVSGNAWRFMTLMGALGLPRPSNIAIVACWPAAAWCLWRLRAIEARGWLVLALALSLAFTPYALAYDMLLLVPVFVYLCYLDRSHLVWCTLTLALMTLIGPRGPLYVGVLITLALLLRQSARGNIVPGLVADGDSLLPT